MNAKDIWEMAANEVAEYADRLSVNASEAASALMKAQLDFADMELRRCAHVLYKIADECEEAVDETE